jgi:hypothetical protein
MIISAWQKNNYHSALAAWLSGIACILFWVFTSLSLNPCNTGGKGEVVNTRSSFSDIVVSPF